MASPAAVGVLGATSLVGRYLLRELAVSGGRVFAFSRSPRAGEEGGVRWTGLSGLDTPGRAMAAVGQTVPRWICAAPLWCLPEHFALLETLGARRVVALSSTSLHTKGDSSDPGERVVARRLACAEEALAAWADARGIEWVALRPTLIYGDGQDRNIARMARFVSRFGFFPVLGRAEGLRQPVHARDVALACVQALEAPVTGRAYDISGATTLTYREMASRVFSAMGREARLVSVPLWLIRAALRGLGLLPGFSGLNPAMAERMNRDMAFDHSDAARDFGFSPRPFELEPRDVRP